MLDLLDVNCNVTGEREIKDPTISEAGDTLDKQVEHLTGKGLQNNNSNELARVGQGSSYERHNNMRLSLSHVELQNRAVVRGGIYHFSCNLVLNRTGDEIALDLKVNVIGNLSSIYYCNGNLFVPVSKASQESALHLVGPTMHCQALCRNFQHPTEEHIPTAAENAGMR